MLSCLWDGAIKRTLAANWKEYPMWRQRIRRPIAPLANALTNDYFKSLVSSTDFDPVWMSLAPVKSGCSATNCLVMSRYVLKAHTVPCCVSSNSYVYKKQHVMRGNPLIFFVISQVFYIQFLSHEYNNNVGNQPTILIQLCSFNCLFSDTHYSTFTYHNISYKAKEMCR